MFRVNDLVDGLVERGHEITVLTGVPNYPDGKIFAAYRKSPKDFAIYAGSPIVRAPMLPRGKSNVSLFFNYLSFAISASIVGPWRL